jgi:hypothetical protein
MSAHPTTTEDEVRTWSILFKKTNGRYMFENLSEHVYRGILTIINAPHDPSLPFDNNIEVKTVNSRGRVINHPNIDDFKLSEIFAFMATEAVLRPQDRYFRSLSDPNKKITTCNVSALFPSY